MRKFALILALLPLLLGATYPERVTLYLYDPNGAPDSLNMVIAVPAGSTLGDTLTVGGAATRVSPGAYVWSGSKVKPALVDIWIGLTPGSAKRSSVLQGIMFGKQSVVDSVLTGANFVRHVTLDSLTVNSYIGGAPISPAVISDTTGMVVDTLYVREKLVVDAGATWEVNGTRVFSDVTVSSILKMTACGTYVFANDVEGPVSVSHTGVRIGDIVLCSLKGTSSPSGYIRTFMGRVSADNTILLQRLIFSGNNAAFTDTVNYVVFKNPL